MIDRAVLGEVDEALRLWESGDLEARVGEVLLVASDDPRDARASHGEHPHEVLAAIAETQAAVAAARTLVAARFERSREVLTVLIAEIEEVKAAFEHASEASLLATRDLHEAVGRIDEEVAPTTDELIDHLEEGVPSAARSTRDGVDERVASFGGRVTSEWLPALHDKIHALDEHLAAVEAQLGAGEQETREALHQDADEASAQVDARTNEQLHSLGSAAQRTGMGVVEAGEATTRVGGVMVDGQHAVQAAGNTAATGLRTALAVLDELLRLYQNVTHQ